MNGFFYVFGPGDDRLGQYTVADSVVTCVKYLPKIRSIAVGYKYGGWQLWDIDTLSMR